MTNVILSNYVFLSIQQKFLGGLTLCSCGWGMPIQPWILSSMLLSTETFVDHSVKYCASAVPPWTTWWGVNFTTISMAGMSTTSVTKRNMSVQTPLVAWTPFVAERQVNNTQRISCSYPTINMQCLLLVKIQ